MVIYTLLHCYIIALNQIFCVSNEVIINAEIRVFIMLLTNITVITNLKHHNHQFPSLTLNRIICQCSSINSPPYPLNKP